jgi:hypothetical protein
MLGTSYDQEAGPSPFLCSRFVKHVFRVSASKPNADDVDTRTELDSHANTCVAGRNTLLVSDDGRRVTVLPYSGKYKPIQDVSIATVTTCGFILTTGNLTSLLSMRPCILGTKLM